MRLHKEKALALRLRGYSYNEISRLLDIPKATLFGWFAHLILSERAQNRIKQRVREGSLRGLIKKNKLQTHMARQRAAAIRKNASQYIKTISKRELLLIGTALYWAEGYKRPIIENGRELTSHVIGFTNSDPHMVKLFIKFLRDVLKIQESKITASIRIFEHINEQEALKFWRKSTQLPKENFRKSYYGVSKSSLGKKPYNRLPYGTIHIVVGDTKNFHRIMGWIEGLGSSLQ